MTLCSQTPCDHSSQSYPTSTTLHSKGLASLKSSCLLLHPDFSQRWRNIRAEESWSLKKVCAGRGRAALCFFLVVPSSVLIWLWRELCHLNLLLDAPSVEAGGGRAVYWPWPPPMGCLIRCWDFCLPGSVLLSPTELSSQPGHGSTFRFRTAQG